MFQSVMLVGARQKIFASWADGVVGFVSVRDSLAPLLLSSPLLGQAMTYVNISHTRPMGLEYRPPHGPPFHHHN